MISKVNIKRAVYDVVQSESLGITMCQANYFIMGEDLKQTIEEFADIMYQLGCKQAYNLDGGNSATLVFNGQVFNEKAADERDVQDIIYFATAVDGE